MTSDNKYLITGSVDGEIYVWDSATHKTIKSFHIHKAAITNIVPITRPINLYGLNANMENVEKVEVPHFQRYSICHTHFRSIGQAGDNVLPWIHNTEKETMKDVLKEVYDGVDVKAMKELLGKAKETEKEHEQIEHKLDNIPMTEVEQLKEENRKLKRAFKELYRVKFDE